MHRRGGERVQLLGACVAHRALPLHRSGVGLRHAARHRRADDGHVSCDAAELREHVHDPRGPAWRESARLHVRGPDERQSSVHVRAPCRCPRDRRVGLRPGADSDPSRPARMPCASTGGGHDLHRRGRRRLSVRIQSVDHVPLQFALVIGPANRMAVPHVAIALRAVAVIRRRSTLHHATHPSPSNEPRGPRRNAEDALIKFARRE